MENKECPCKKKKCERHGKCDLCRAHHEQSKRHRPVACEKKKEEIPFRINLDFQVLGSDKFEEKMRMDNEMYKLFLAETRYVDYSHPEIQKETAELFNEKMSAVEKAKIAYFYVRDEIGHSFDINTNIVSVTASECLINKTGVCHVKSNLLAALLRSQGIPTGFCFQHLAWDDTDPNNIPGFVTHGYNAVFLNGKWIKLDARGNKENVHAEFSLDKPVLAFSVNEEIGEYDVKGIFASPNMSSMQYLESLCELDPKNYTDCNEVLLNPEILDED